MKLVIDTDARTLTQQEGASETTIDLYSKQAFEAISLQWVRTGWAMAYYHTFSWFGLPILQLPEDLVRIQEVIYQLRPQVIIEVGIFRGGSALYYASLLEALGHGRLIAVDIHIPAEVRHNIETNPLSKRIKLVEGSSADPVVVEQIKRAVGPAAPVLVLLDSDHSKKHVAAELELFGPLVTPGSYIVVGDGFMKDICDVPGGSPEWMTDNPYEAAKEFAARHPEFLNAPPKWPHRQSELSENVTYWPGGWLQRVG
jgi:cephalosporin hydroxylase